MIEKKTILVADDEVNVIKALTFVLTREGYEVSSAKNGEEAVARIRELRPSLVFLDIMMPKKSGYEVCQEIKGDPELGNTYVIILSAKGQQVDREKGLRLGADEFITKPFSPLSLVKRVKEILR